MYLGIRAENNLNYGEKSLDELFDGSYHLCVKLLPNLHQVKDFMNTHKRVKVLDLTGLPEITGLDADYKVTYK